MCPETACETYLVADVKVIVQVYEIIAKSWNSVEVEFNSVRVECWQV